MWLSLQILHCTYIFSFSNTSLYFKNILCNISGHWILLLYSQIMHPYFPNTSLGLWAYYIFRLDCCKRNLFLYRFCGATFMHCIGWFIFLATPRYSEGSIHVRTNCHHLALLHWWNWIVQHSSLEPKDIPSNLSILHC